MFALGLSENQPSAPDTLNVLLIRLAEELYALPSASVREVLRYRAYTPVPGAPPTLPGILSQRGTILPVVDPHPLLGVAAEPITRASRLVVVGQDDVVMALLAEAVLDLTALPADAFEPLPAGLDPERARFLQGIVRHEQQTIALLDLDEMIAGLRA